MDDWGAGYVTDIAYSDGFYAAQAPRHIALTAVFNGHVPPDFESGFTYCELGCGRGSTSLVLAATYPEATFHAIDFNPAHIAHAREQARAAQLTNVFFHEVSFADLLAPGAPDLPMFDIVTMHGVWTWIAPELQEAILAFLDRRVTPGGLVYVSYNALPAWSPMLPLQRILRELSALHPGRSDRAVASALEMIGRLKDAGMIPEPLAGAARRLLESPQRHNPTYLAHEYANAHWRPVFHADVARSLGHAKLTYAGSSELMRNFGNLVATEPQRAILEAIPVTELRETLQDFCGDNWFRRDVFVRGARRLTEGERTERLSGLTLALQRPPPPVIQIMRSGNQIWRPDPDVYERIVAALTDGPRTVAELLSLPGLPQGHLVRPLELVGVLVGSDLAVPVEAASPDATAAAARLNALSEVEEVSPTTNRALIAVPGMKGGLTLTAVEVDLVYTAQRRGMLDAEALAERFFVRCRREGVFPIIDGAPVEDEANARTALTEEYARLIERTVPLWRHLGVV